LAAKGSDPPLTELTSSESKFIHPGESALDAWIFSVLILIFVQLLRLGSRLDNTVEKDGALELQKELRELLKELREEFYWFKDNNFAHHLFSEIKENCATLEREIREMNQSLGSEINDVAHVLKSLHDNLKDIAETVQRIEDNTSR
jgi:L-lysine 2,3-aminomutase